MGPGGLGDIPFGPLPEPWPITVTSYPPMTTTISTNGTNAEVCEDENEAHMKRNRERAATRTRGRHARD